MILIRYIFKKICKNQSIILSLLFLICFCQKLIKILGLYDNIPMHLIFLCIVFNLPELGKLTIPFSLFLSALITCYRLHSRNEILAMYSCAISKYIFIKSMLIYSSIISCLAIINMFYLCPYAEQYRNNMLSEIKKNTYYIELTENKFQFLFDKNLVLFINKTNNSKLQYIFAVTHNQNKNSNTLGIITADQGDLIYNTDNSQSMILQKGTYHEIHYNHQKCTNIYVINFSTYQILVNYGSKLSLQNNDKINWMPLKTLWNASCLETQIEFSWCLTLLVSIFIMPIIALLLIINISNNYLPKFLLAIILYIVFFVLHILLRAFPIYIQINPIICMWMINLVYLILVFIINFWEYLRLKIFSKNIFLYLFKK